MPEKVLNRELGHILANHGVPFIADEEFLLVYNPSTVKFKAKSIYTEVNNKISSQLDIIAIPDNGKPIIESFGDFGDSLEEAINRNFSNFCLSGLHLFLSAFGPENHVPDEQITVENWEINGQYWKAFIGNLIPKVSGNKTNDNSPPPEFFEYFEESIRAQILINDIHWFRGFFLQYNNEMRATEFMMDNLNITAACPLFSKIPLKSNVEYYSCRIFIILKKLDNMSKY